MDNDCRRQFIDGDRIYSSSWLSILPPMLQLHPLHQLASHINELLGFLGIGLRRSPAAAPAHASLSAAVQRFHLSLPYTQDRFDLEQFPNQGFGSSDATALLKVFQSIYQEIYAASAIQSSRRLIMVSASNPPLAHSSASRTRLARLPATVSESTTRTSSLREILGSDHSRRVPSRSPWRREQSRSHSRCILLGLLEYRDVQCRRQARLFSGVPWKL